MTQCPTRPFYQYHIELATEAVPKYVVLNAKPSQSQNSVNIDKEQSPTN